MTEFNKGTRHFAIAKSRYYKPIELWGGNLLYFIPSVRKKF